IPSHEKYAFENEITVFMNKNEYKGDILKMAHGIDLIKQY
ncbi:sugar transferase, partial [Campylobacter jejuni]|nr:sugar transferase [Campylobacter jejuni]